MTTIYLIRHAEAEGNLYRRSQGQYDANVTQLGRAQIGALAERFREVPIDALWSSDLNRARSTATAILKYHPGLTLHTTPALRELGMGEWEDVPWGELARRYPEQLALFSTDPARWSAPGCERFEDLPARIEKTLLSLAEAYEGKTVAVVSHGLAIRSLLCRIFAVPFAQIPYGDNTSVALLTAECGRLSAQWYNDSSHLPDELSTFARQSWRKEDGGREYTLLEPLDPQREGGLYTRCYGATWQASHGNLTGFTPALYLRTAVLRAGDDPRCLVKLVSRGEFAGLIELDPERGKTEGAGWISLIYVEPEQRRRRMGFQLLGHAVSYFRRQGRDRLRLHVSQTNGTALGFYRRCGFVPVEETDGVGGRLYLMEMDIAQRPWTLP